VITALQHICLRTRQRKVVSVYVQWTLAGIMTGLLSVWSSAQVVLPSAKEVHRIFTDRGPVNMKSTSLHADKNGFLWFGAFDGLHRYDGYDLKTYRQLPGEAQSIKGGLIISIQEDHAGFMWIGTELGLNRFDPAMDTFGTIPIFNDATADVEEGGIQDIHIGEDGVPWVMVSVFGLGWVDAARNRVQHFVLDSTPLVLAPFAYHSKFGKKVKCAHRTGQQPNRCLDCSGDQLLILARGVCRISHFWGTDFLRPGWPRHPQHRTQQYRSVPHHSRPNRRCGHVQVLYLDGPGKRSTHRTPDRPQHPQRQWQFRIHCKFAG